MQPPYLQRNNDQVHLNSTPIEEDVRSSNSDAANIAIAAIVLALINLFFIIPNLIFASQENDCVNTYVNGIAFTLSTWLKVDAYIRISLLIFLMIVAIVTCINQELGNNLLHIFYVLLVLYILFAIAWAFVGSFMFWQRLNPAGKCTGGVQIYMHIVLSLTFGLLCCLTFLSQLK